jgi:hypothetical protein
MPMWLLLAGVALANDCPDDGLATALEQAAALQGAFVGLDEEAFEAAEQALSDALPCVDNAVSTDDAVKLHAAHALIRFGDEDTIGTTKSWAAIRSLDASWSPAFLPEGHRLRELWVGARPGTERTVLESAPVGGWLVDGAATSEVVTDQAFVLQAVGAGDSITHTGYHYSLAEVPMVDLVESLDDPGAARRRRRRARTVGTVLATGLAAGSATSFVMAFGAKEKLPDAAAADVERHRVAYNTGLGFGGGLAGAGTIVATLAWSVW